MNKKVIIGISAVCLAAAWAVVWPRVRTLKALDGDGRAYGAIITLREQIARYTAEHGAPPPDLSGMNPPELKLYSFDGPESDRIHRHRVITEVLLVPDYDLAGLAYATSTYRDDEGKWLYNPRTGDVVLGCSGVDTKHRRPWYSN